MNQMISQRIEPMDVDDNDLEQEHDDLLAPAAGKGVVPSSADNTSKVALGNDIIVSILEIYCSFTKLFV